MRIFSGHCEVMKMAKLTDCRGTTNMPLHCKETNTMMFIDKKKQQEHQDISLLGT